MPENKLKSRTIIFICAAMLLLIVIPGDMNYFNPGYLSGFLMQNWSISYDTGFVLRGLPGSVLSLVSSPITPQTVMIANVIFMLIYLSFLFIAAKSLIKHDSSAQSVLFLLFLMAQPPVLQRWVSSSTLGRLDTLMAAVFVSIVFIIINSRKLYLKYILTNILTIIALLSHEGFAVFFVPSVFALFLFYDEKPWRTAVFYLAPSAVAWVLITAFGGADVPVGEFMAALNERAVVNGNYPFEQYKIESVYYMGIKEKISYTFAYYNETIVAKVIITFGLLSPSLYCLGGYIKSAIKNAESKKEKVLIHIYTLAALTPFFALIFATDTYRWIGWSLFNLTAVVAVLYIMNDKYRAAMQEFTKKKVFIISFAFIATLLLSYFTVFSSYPIVEKYFPALYSFFFG